MSAVLILTNTMAISVPAWVWAVAIVVSVALGAVAQWIVSAKSRRQTVVRCVLAATAIAPVYFLTWCDVLGWDDFWCSMF